MANIEQYAARGVWDPPMYSQAVRVTGGQTTLLGMTQRGKRSLRPLLSHGARAVLRVVDRQPDPRSRWLQGVTARRGKHGASVAQATKTARIAWALLAKGDQYRQAV